MLIPSREIIKSKYSNIENTLYLTLNCLDFFSTDYGKELGMILNSLLDYILQVI